MPAQQSSQSFFCCNPGCALEGKELDAAKAGKNDGRCFLCDQPLRTTADITLSSLSPSEMPTYLAIPWQAYLKEKHPRIKLHWLIDTAEVALRWCVAIAFAEIVAGGGGKLPAKLAKEIREIILRPTLGAWLNILHILSLDGNKPDAPLIAPGVFDLYQRELNPRFRSESSGGTCKNSLLELRNQFVHGGGISSKVAEELVACHRENIGSLLKTIVSSLPDIDVVNLSNGTATLLQGTNPKALACIPASIEGKEDGPWLVSGDKALPLFPLLEYSPIQQMGDDGQLLRLEQNDTPQVYHRASLERERISYTPLGSDALCAERFDISAFYQLFQFETSKVRKKGEPCYKTDSYHWRDFLEEARNNIRPLVGRDADIGRVRKWLKGRDSRHEGVAPIAWIHGAPGIGKSLLMARLALDAANEQKRQRTFYHCFRGGDARNNRRSFLGLLQECLLEWVPLAATTPPRTNIEDDKALLADVTSRLEAIKELSNINENNPKAPTTYPRLLVFLDGIDELAIHERTFPNLVKQLALPGTVWIVAGRNEHGIGQMFIGPACETLFDDEGLPKLTPNDIRSLLMENALPAIRRNLLQLDIDKGDDTSNTFIERVVRNSDGLPLYVNLVIEDLESGRIRVDQWNDLPEGLTAYYNRLLDRMGISTVQKYLCDIVCILASAEEPLDSESLAHLLTADEYKLELVRKNVNKALRVGATLVKCSETPEGTIGFVLYHQSFRNHISGKNDADGNGMSMPAEKTLGILLEARAKLTSKANKWSKLPEGNLKNHLFRCGNNYALWWGGDDGLVQAHERLTDFNYLMERNKVLPSADITELVKEYAKVYQLLPEGEQKQAFRYWEAFFRERAHILRRGNDQWPVYKILLQLGYYCPSPEIVKLAQRLKDHGTRSDPVEPS